MLRSNKDKGFTIIEVVLVLAIAGLIFLTVFLALPALHTLPAQESLRVQALPSLHAAVFALVWQAPLTGLHESVVHGLPSLQSVALPASAPSC